MSTDKMIVQAETDKTEEELQNDEKNAVPEKPSEENKYKIFDFFKAHLGLLATCVSAVVAIMSIIFNFSVGHMNYAYLEYWDISTLHANTNNQNEIHLVACALLYFLSIMFVNGLFSGAADAFRYYNKILSRMQHTIKDSKQRSKRLSKMLRKLTKKVNRLAKADGAGVEEIQTDIAKYEGILNQGKKSLQGLNKASRSIASKVIIEIIITIVVSYLVLGFALFLLNFSSTAGERFRDTLPAFIFIVWDFLAYFVPAYFTTRCSHKQFQEEDTTEVVLELIETEVPTFPVEKFAANGIKSFLSDKSIKMGLTKLAISTVILVLIISMTGTVSASEQRRFPIYMDGEKTYAIVYFSGSTVFMEEATYQDGTITIDTSKQRIVTTDDLTYDRRTFEEVILTGKETPKEEKNNTSNIINGISSFFKTIKSKFTGCVNQNDGPASGNECQSTTGN